MSRGEEQGCFRNRKNDESSILKELRDFTLSGNFIRIAAAFILALALERLITQFVASWISPAISMMGGRSFKNLSFTVSGSEFAYGMFIDALISFLMIFFVIFFLLILPLQRYAGKCMPAWEQSICEHCYMSIPAIASKCAYCGSDVIPKKVLQRTP